MNTEPALSPPDDDGYSDLVEAIAEERARDLMADATSLWEFVYDDDTVDIWPDLATALTLITTPAANTNNRDLATAKLKRIAERVLEAMKQDQLASARKEAALVQRKRMGPKQWDGGVE